MSFKKLIIMFSFVLFLNTFNSVYAFEADEENKTIIAVIDSKINTEHENIKYNCLVGKSFLLNDSNKTGHGTSVAGAVVKYSFMTAKQLLVEKSNIVILPIEINVLDIQTDYGKQIGDAIKYAVDNGADIVNMSFSCSSPNMYIYEKIRYGIEKGVIFVSASGNSGYSIYSFPAAYDGVISVGSYNLNNDGAFKRSSFSNSNDDVDIMMNGEKMLLPDELSGYTEKTGTSFSAGAFSGMLGELINRYPNIYPEHIVYALYDTATPLKNEAGTGYGIPDVMKAKEYLDNINEKSKSLLSYESTQSLLSSKVNDVKPLKISAGRSHIAIIEDGKIKIEGNKSSNRAGVSNFKDIIEVYACNDNTAAINSKNTPVATGYNVFNKNILRGWTDVKTLALSPNFTAGLTNDGHVYVTDYLSKIEKKKWDNIKQISSGSHHIAAVTASGEVLTAGYNIYHQMDTAKWQNIIFTASNVRNTVGIDKYGYAYAVGDNLYQQCNLDNWNDIRSIDVGDGFVVGLKANGTVVAKGRNIYNVCQVEDLKDIIYIDCADTYFIAVDNKNNYFIKGKMR